MYAASPFAVLALTLAALFGVIGLVHLAGPGFLRTAYDRWNYPQRFRLVLGLLTFIAAASLADPALRGWGIGIAAVVNFGAVVTHLHHRQYLLAAPAIVMMAALVPATLAVPRHSSSIRFEAAARRIPQPLAADAQDIASSTELADAGV